jgi:hypothetical protein
MNVVIRAKIDYNYLGVYDITLAGHSGAYRVISRIINKTPVSEVILFDAMYGGNDAYLNGCLFRNTGSSISIQRMAERLITAIFIMKQLTDSLHVPMISLNEDDVNEKLLRDNNKLFMFSSKGHNEVITNNRNWERFLRNIPAKK